MDDRSIVELRYAYMMRGRNLLVVLAIGGVIPGCASALPPLTPSPSPTTPDLVFATYRSVVQADSDRLQEIEWDFHTAVRSQEPEEARERAAAAVETLSSITAAAPTAGLTECQRELVAGVDELVGEQVAVWERRSNGRAFPSADQVDLFFAFYGATKPWVVLLDEAATLCGVTAT